MCSYPFISSLYIFFIYLFFFYTQSRSQLYTVVIVTTCFMRSMPSCEFADLFIKLPLRMTVGKIDAQKRTARFSPHRLFYCLSVSGSSHPPVTESVCAAGATTILHTYCKGKSLQSCTEVWLLSVSERLPGGIQGIYQRCAVCCLFSKCLAVIHELGHTPGPRLCISAKY